MEKAKLTNDPVIERFIGASIDLIESRIFRSFDDITPEVSRKIELLEVLAVSVIEHAENPTLLSNLEAHIDAMANLNGARMQ
jgi:hypothetical protein